MTRRVLTTRQVTRLELGVPEGHKHLRARLVLEDGDELVLQEATVAALVRAYTEVKIHPLREKISLTGRELEENEPKPGFARWQLLEE